MKTNAFVIFSLIALILITGSCDKNEINDKKYIDLETVNIFTLSDEMIVDSITSILDIKAFAFEGIVDRWEDDHGVAACDWIKEGKKYVNTDGQSIILWKDSLENLNTITYLHYRKSVSESWSNDNAELVNYLKTIFSGLGLIKKSNESYSINEAAGGIQNIKWYDILCNQTFNANTINHPEFKADIEGDTCKINYLMIPVWYTNLDEINTSLSENEMEENAINFLENNYEGIGNTIEHKGYWIVYNTLCYAIDANRIGDRGIFRVFIDVQTGEIVHNTLV